jgi:hypothetical protein
VTGNVQIKRVQVYKMSWEQIYVLVKLN